MTRSLNPLRVTRGSMLQRLLQKPLVTLTEEHFDYVDNSRLVWGARPITGTMHNDYALTPLGLLNSLPKIGVWLALDVREAKPRLYGCDVCGGEFAVDEHNLTHLHPHEGTDWP